MTKHFAAGFGHQHVILDANANTPPLLVHRGVIRRHIQTRLHGQRHARLQLAPLFLNAVITHVMHIQTQPMAGAVHKELSVAFRFHQLVEFPFQQAQVDQPLSQYIHHLLVGHVPVVVRVGSFDGRILAGQHQLIQRLLWLAECAAHRKGTGNIGCIMFQLATGIHQHQITGFQLSGVFDVMKNAAVGAATDNARVGRAARTVAHEFVDIFRFQLVFHHPRLDRLHGAHMGAG